MCFFFFLKICAATECLGGTHRSERVSFIAVFVELSDISEQNVSQRCCDQNLMPAGTMMETLTSTDKCLVHGWVDMTICCRQMFSI